MDSVAIALKLGISLLLIVGAAVDLKTRRIPNFLTFGGAVMGAVANTALGGRDGLVLSGTGWIAGVTLLAIPFMLRGIGGGDVKLLAAVGAWGGPAYVLNAAFLSALVGSLVAVGFLLARGELGLAFNPLVRMLRGRINFALSGVVSGAQSQHLRPKGTAQTASPMKVYFPFGPALAMGGLLALFLR